MRPGSAGLAHRLVAAPFWTAWGPGLECSSRGPFTDNGNKNRAQKCRSSMDDRAGRVNSRHLGLVKVSLSAHEPGARQIWRFEASRTADRAARVRLGLGVLRNMGSPTDSCRGSSTTVLADSANPDSSGVGTRVQLGLIGLDRAGQFHAERLSLRPEFEVV